MISDCFEFNMAMIENPVTEIFNSDGEDFNLTELLINQFYLKLESNVRLFTKNAECEGVSTV